MPHPVTIEAMANWLIQHDDIVLIGHVKPDGDAVGSCMAAMFALEQLGKRCFVYLSDGVPGIYKKYPQAERVISSGQAMPFTPKTAFSLDVSDEERLGDGRALFDAAVHRAVVDHHATNPGFGDVWYVDGRCCACGEIVLALIEAFGLPLRKEMATWLFIALSTDSGHFRFSNVTGDTLRCAAKLVDAGIDLASLTRDLWSTRTLPRTRLLGSVLNRLEISDDGSMCWSYVTKDMLKASGAKREDNEGIINYLLEVEGVEFAFLAEELDDGVKFSLRSKLYLDVAQEIALPLGGGGHKHAAGCTLKEPMGDAIERMKALGLQKLSRLSIGGDA